MPKKPAPPIDKSVVPKKQPTQKLDLSAAIEMRYKNHLTYQQIADYFGVSKQAVESRLQRFKAMIGDPEEAKAFESHEALIQQSIKARYAERLLECDLTEAKPKELATVYGIAYDKHRLTTGQSSANVAILHADAAIVGWEEQCGRGKDEGTRTDG